MLDKIKNTLFQTYKKDEVRGIFFSAFDKKNNLITSNGVFHTDKPMNELIDIIFNGLLINHTNETQTMVIDVITDNKKENDISTISNLSMKEFGIFLINEQTQKSGIILPNTKGVENASGALNLIKQKFGLNGDVSIYTFKTDRVIIN
ncbi:MAG: hypothetical protein WC872_00830 [Candidatus Absconditabacterales bacterium]